MGISVLVRYLVLAIEICCICVAVSGCHILGVEGPFSGNRYSIFKIEVDDNILYAPQVITYQARQRLKQSKSSDYKVQDPQLNSEVLRMDLDKGPPHPKALSLSELSRIQLESSFILDRTNSVVSGQAGCNGYTARFFWQGSDKIVISGGASTHTLCQIPEIMEFEDSLISHFDGIFTVTKVKHKNYSYVLDNGVMKIFLE